MKLSSRNTFSKEFAQVWRHYWRICISGEFQAFEKNILMLTSGNLAVSFGLRRYSRNVPSDDRWVSTKRQRCSFSSAANYKESGKVYDSNLGSARCCLFCILDTKKWMNCSWTTALDIKCHFEIRLFWLILARQKKCSQIVYTILQQDFKQKMEQSFCCCPLLVLEEVFYFCL